MSDGFDVSQPRIAVVIPVLDDWDSLAILLAEFPSQVDLGASYHFFVIDDGSHRSMSSALNFPADCLGTLVRLGASLGHQRAICVGLNEVLKLGAFDCVLVMDGDGEDNPQHVFELLEEFRSARAEVVVAQRATRTEGFRFRLFYRIYKALFRLLTGRRLDFGNFSLLSEKAVKRLLFMPELWNHFPGTIMRSGVGIIRVPTPRSPRLAGTSRMSFVSLVNHGVSGISVFIDQVLARLMVLAGVVAATLVAFVAAGLALRFSTGTPIPGWAALISVAAAIGLLQTIGTLLIIGFFSLSTRSRYSPPPIDFADDYVQSTQVLSVASEGARQ